jgi:hypothetical protein
VKPRDIRARLAALREAGDRLRRRPALDVLDPLGRVLDGWSCEGSPWRRALEAELPLATGFSPETVREGLRLGLEGWTGGTLRALVHRELGGPERLDARADGAVGGFEVTAVLLAGSIPMPTLLALLAPLVLRSPVLAKCASRDPVTARLVARSLAEVDADLGHCVEVVAFPGDDEACSDALLEADCVVASGSDATVAALRGRVHPQRRLVAYGHRVSAAALGPEALTAPRLAEVAGRLARDVALWDQLGCLSPVSIYAVGASGAAALAEALAEALETAQRVMPRGAPSPAAAAAFAHERAEAELRAANRSGVALRAAPDDTWAVVLECDTALRPAPLHRFVRVVPLADAEALPEALAPLAPHLAGVALDGFGPSTPHVVARLARLGASRLCAPGRLQGPPLGWHHDGQGVLTPLARFTDVEVPV